MDSRLEGIVIEFSRKRYRYTNDDVFEKISYEVNLETLLLRILSLRYLDYNCMNELEVLGIPMAKYISEYRNITEGEARALIDYKYVTSYIVLDVLEFILKR